MKKQEKSIKIYYDDNCPTCTLYKNKDQKSGGKWVSNTELGNSKITDRQIVVEKDGRLLKNIDAIAAIEESKGNAFWAKLLRQKLLKPFLRLGYRIISFYRKQITGEYAPRFWIKTIVGLGFLGAMSVSWRLWTNFHDFPSDPLLGQLGVGLLPFSNVLAVLMAASLLGLVFTRKKTSWWVGLFLLLATLLVIGDLNRLRPWLYQLSALLIGLVVVKDKKVLPQAFFVVLAATYFWGGLQKLNNYFVNEIFPWFVSPLTNAIPIHTEVVSLAAVVVVVIEMSIGVLLFIPRYRYGAAVLATITHLFIVTVLPIGHHWGFVVLFWNLALMFVVWVSTQGKRGRSPWYVMAPIVLLLGIMPMANWFGVWDNYLSLALYANETDRGYIILDKGSYGDLPENSRLNVIIWNDEKIAVDTLMWSYQNYNTALYTNDRTYKKALSVICEIDSSAELYLRAKIRYFRTVPGKVITCEMLQNQPH